MRHGHISLAYTQFASSHIPHSVRFLHIYLCIYISRSLGCIHCSFFFPHFFSFLLSLSKEMSFSLFAFPTMSTSLRIVRSNRRSLSIQSFDFSACLRYTCDVRIVSGSNVFRSQAVRSKVGPEPAAGSFNLTIASNALQTTTHLPVMTKLQSKWYRKCAPLLICCYIVNISSQSK